MAHYLAVAFALVGVAFGAYQRGRHVQAKRDLEMMNTFVELDERWRVSNE